MESVYTVLYITGLQGNGFLGQDDWYDQFLCLEGVN